MNNDFEFIGTTAEERENVSLYGYESVFGAQAQQPKAEPSEAAMTASEGLRYMKAARLMTQAGYYELVDRLKVMNHAYYQLGEPMVSDAEFDCLLLQAQAVEELHPAWTLPDSPTQVVGNDSVTGLPKVYHRTPMLSLSKAAGNTEELKRENLTKWFKNTAEGLNIVAEYKYDGNSVSLVYMDGQLIEASTRGNDGTCGSLITAQVSSLPTVPNRIDAKGRVEVRGELYIPTSRYNALLSWDKAKTQQAQVRKVLQQVSRPTLAAEQGFEFRAWEVCSVCCDDIATPSSHTSRMEWAAQQGFTIAPMTAVATIDDILTVIDRMTADRDNIDQPTDGIVLKLDDDDDRAIEGETAKHPKWAIAWKYPAREITVTVTAVTATASGKPCLHFDTITIDGTDYSKVDVRSAAMQQHPFRIGDRITIALKPGSSSIQFTGITNDPTISVTSTNCSATTEPAAPVRPAVSQQEEPEAVPSSEATGEITTPADQQPAARPVSCGITATDPSDPDAEALAAFEADYQQCLRAERERIARMEAERQVKAEAEQARLRELQEECRRKAEAARQQRKQAEALRRQQEAEQARKDRRRAIWKGIGYAAAACVACVVIFKTGLLIPLGLIGLATGGIIK